MARRRFGAVLESAIDFLHKDAHEGIAELVGFVSFEQPRKQV